LVLSLIEDISTGVGKTGLLHIGLGGSLKETTNKQKTKKLNMARLIQVINCSNEESWKKGSNPTQRTRYTADKVGDFINHQRDLASNKTTEDFNKNTVF